MSMTPQARSAYRALLREHPRRNLRATTTTTPLHNRLREHFRTGTLIHETTTPMTSSTTTPPNTKPNTKINTGEEGSETRAQKIQEAEQMARYAKAQREYARLLELYNPGLTMDEEEKIRLTARRVGFELPVVGGR